MGTRVGKPTLVSLARELGVSRQTVSNVINAPDVVSPDTRRRVQEAITHSGYRPSALGRALQSRRSHVLAFRMAPLFNQINAAVMDHFLHELIVAAQEHGYRLDLVAAENDADELAELMRLHAMGAIDGCILTGTSIGDVRPERLAQAGLAVVAFGRPWGSLPGGHPWIDVDGSAATRAAVEALRARGHHRIGYLGWPSGSGVGDDRRRGWYEGVQGLIDEPDHWTTAAHDDDPRAGHLAAMALRERGATALVCASDALAIAAYPAFVDPQDAFVPVIGFDDTPAVRALGLSSCAQPVEEAAHWCVEQLVRAIEYPDDAPGDSRRLLQAQVVLRERITS